MLWSGWPSADACCLPGSCSANPALPTLPPSRASCFLYSPSLNAFLVPFITFMVHFDKQSRAPPRCCNTPCLQSFKFGCNYDNNHAIISINADISAHIWPPFSSVLQKQKVREILHSKKEPEESHRELLAQNESPRRSSISSQNIQGIQFCLDSLHMIAFPLSGASIPGGPCFCLLISFSRENTSATAPRQGCCSYRLDSTDAPAPNQISFVHQEIFAGCHHSFLCLAIT